MIMKGQKRKVPPEDVEASDRSSPLWESQRQFVLTVSLSKYQRGQELPEPSLRRSVLIANTLRQVSLESFRVPPVESEASQPHCSSSSELQESPLSTADRHQSTVMFAASHSPLVSCAPDSSNCATTRSPESCHSTVSNTTLSEKGEDEDWGLMTMDPDFALSAAISSVLTALDSTIDGSQQVTPRTPLRSLENLPEPSEGGVAWMKQGVKGYEGSLDQQQECRVWESSIEVMRSSYLSDLTVEDLFQDIDTSLLERDIGVVGVRGTGGGYTPGDDLLRYLPPLSTSPSQPSSISFNQNQKCLPSFSSFCPTSPSSSSSSSSSLSLPPLSNQNHMREGLDLDHLMEILVES